ncbi:MAG TPA: hypothetical protein VIY09_08590, partial [Rhizomicrobium sp.]
MGDLVGGGIRGEGMARGGGGSPAEYLQIPAHIFDEHGAAFNPVAIFETENARLRPENVAAHAICCGVAGKDS